MSCTIPCTVWPEDVKSSTITNTAERGLTDRRIGRALALHSHVRHVEARGVVHDWRHPAPHSASLVLAVCERRWLNCHRYLRRTCRSTQSRARKIDMHRHAPRSRTLVSSLPRLCTLSSCAFLGHAHSGSWLLQLRLAPSVASRRTQPSTDIEPQSSGVSVRASSPTVTVL